MNEDFDIRREMSSAEKDFENALRPLRFHDFSGQKKVVENLEVFVEAAKYRGEPLDHRGDRVLGHDHRAEFAHQLIDAVIDLRIGVIGTAAQQDHRQTLRARVGQHSLPLGAHTVHVVRVGGVGRVDRGAHLAHRQVGEVLVKHLRKSLSEILRAVYAQIIADATDIASMLHAANYMHTCIEDLAESCEAL